jgi:CubicO group peptidase (beta-lactamase class C family)
MSDADVVRAAARVLEVVATNPRFRHTSHLRVDVGNRTIVDEHLRGPEIADVFSITKSVLSTVLAVLSADRGLPPWHQRLVEVLPELRGEPAAEHTWWQLLTMTRGARTEGAWDVDQVTALPSGQVRHIARAPQEQPPGTVFRYDNAGSHLVSAAASTLLGESVAAYAARRLFEPLDIDAEWRCDPDGVPFGYAHLRLSADGLARLGRLWLQDGWWQGRRLMAPHYLSAMVAPQTSGGPPEDLPYGLLTWVGDDLWLAAGWAGQHLMVLPSARAVVVATGDPEFTFGPPPADRLPPDWLPAVVLVRRHLLPALR